jgi:hypothetical protein
VDEIRYHFGERVAYYFAFQELYTSWLKPIALFGLFFWILFCGFGPSAILYWRGITIFGFLVSTVWTPAMLKHWKQRTQVLNFRWGLLNWSEELDPNPDFDWGLENENAMVMHKCVEPYEARQCFFRHVTPGTDRIDFEGFRNLCKELPGLESYKTEEQKLQKFNILDMSGSGNVEVGSEIKIVLSMRCQLM